MSVVQFQHCASVRFHKAGKYLYIPFGQQLHVGDVTVHLREYIFRHRRIRRAGVFYIVILAACCQHRHQKQCI